MWGCEYVKGEISKLKLKMRCLSHLDCVCVCVCVCVCDKIEMEYDCWDDAINEEAISMEWVKKLIQTKAHINARPETDVISQNSDYNIENYPVYKPPIFYIFEKNNTNPRDMLKLFLEAGARINGICKK